MKALIALWTAYTGAVTAVASTAVWWQMGSPPGLAETSAGLVVTCGAITAIIGVVTTIWECVNHLRLRWEDEGGTR